MQPQVFVFISSFFSAACISLEYKGVVKIVESWGTEKAWFSLLDRTPGRQEAGNTSFSEKVHGAKECTA